MISAITARNFVASVWFSTHGLSKKEKLYAKARELVSGDRTEYAVSSGDITYFEIALKRQISGDRE